MKRTASGLYLPSGVQNRVDAAALRKPLFAGRLPWSERYRNVYGRAMDLDRIENALLAARVGIMVDIADLAREQLMMDPHLGKLPQKRFGALKTVGYTLKPRTEGLSRDEKRVAVGLCEMVRAKLRACRNLKQAIYDLAWGFFDGRAALEIAWEWGAYNKNPYTPTAIDWIHPRRLGFGPQRELRLIETFVRVGWFEPVGLALADVPGKFMTIAPRRFGDYPELEGLAPRSIYYSFFKRFGWRQRMKLMELFALPWRTLESDKDAPIQREDMEAAVEDAERLGDESTAAFVPGLRLKVEWPGSDNQGQIFDATEEHVDAQMSKLWLLVDDGEKGGSDAAGVGGDQAQLKQRQHDLALQMDGVDIAEVFQRDLVDQIVLLNAGLDALNYAPLFDLSTQPARDRVTTQKVYSQALQDGVPIALTDYYADLDLRQPDDDEPLLVMTPGEGGQGTIKILVPPGAKAPAGMLPPAAPTAGASTATSSRGTSSSDGAENGTEGPAPIGQGERAGSLLPRTDQQTPLDEPNTAGGGNEPEWEPGAGDEDDDISHVDPMAQAELPNQRMSPMGQPELASDDGLQPGEELTDAVRHVLGLTRQAFRLSRQPDLGHGSPEVIIDRGLREGARYTSTWAAMVTTGVDGLASATAIHRALAQAEKALPLEQLAASLERCMVRSLMLGALDAAWEAEEGEPVAISAFGRGAVLMALGKPTPGFAATPFADAIRFFLSKRVLTRREFDRLRAEAKQKAFTVAGLARTELLQTAKDALAKSIEAGSDLRAFRKDLDTRFDSAGWTRLKPSHVELVFRNNVMGSYADGRDRQMRQPEVLAARPYWQILGIDDARTRGTHRAAHGKVLRADDGFWSSASPPFGHNCRCRKVSRSQRDLDRLKLTVTSGAALRGLPDPGWR